jgi:RNA polymerase sigma-70 factor (ECF subfamily)
MYGPQGDLSIQLEGLGLRHREELADQIERLYQLHYGALFRYLVHTGRSPADADEFIQEAFLRLIQTLREGKRVEKPKNWLLGVLHHIGIDEVRRSNRHVEYDALPADARAGQPSDWESTPEGAVLRQERADRLTKALQQLTERQYRYLLLRTEGLKLREIAKIFGVTVQSVAEACARAVDHLGRSLHE